MVGQTITVSGGSHIVDTGVFLITGYTSASVISIANPLSVVDSSLHWAVLPSPTCVAGDITKVSASLTDPSNKGAYLSVCRAGVGVTAVTTMDPFFEFIEVQAEVSPSASNGNWLIQAGTPVQNIGGLHPLLASVSVPVNSWTVTLSAFENSGGTISAVDLIPTTTSGTNGAPVTMVSGLGYSTFVDSTAGTFTASMVGATIVITGGTGTTAGNNGTFTILQFVNVNQIVISNPAAVTTTGLSWTVTQPALVHLELTMNNTGPFQGSPQ
jgi:hypothetical protein